VREGERDSDGTGDGGRRARWVAGKRRAVGGQADRATWPDRARRCPASTSAGKPRQGRPAGTSGRPARPSAASGRRQRRTNPSRQVSARVWAATHNERGKTAVLGENRDNAGATHNRTRRGVPHTCVKDRILSSGPLLLLQSVTKGDACCPPAYSREQKYCTTPGPERKREYLNGYKINRGKTTLRRSLFRIAFSWYDSRVDRIIRCLEIINNMVFMRSAAVAMMGSIALGIPQLSIGRSDHPINLYTDSLENCKAAEKTLGPCYASSP
jgi:hypothetical protein